MRAPGRHRGTGWTSWGRAQANGACPATKVPAADAAHRQHFSLTLFPEIGGQFKIRRAEVLRGCELCDIRVLLNFETVETTDIRVLRQ